MQLIARQSVGVIGRKVERRKEPRYTECDLEPISFAAILDTVRQSILRRYPLLKDEALGDILDREVFSRASIAYTARLKAQGRNLEAWATVKLGGIEA